VEELAAEISIGPGENAQRNRAFQLGSV